VNFFTVPLSCAVELMENANKEIQKEMSEGLKQNMRPSITTGILVQTFNLLQQ
jgi:hypothetical protein